MPQDIHHDVLQLTSPTSHKLSQECLSIRAITLTRRQGDKYTDNVKQVSYTYTNGKFTLSTASTITTLTGADGVITLPDGSLIVGGEGSIWKINPNTGAKQMANPGGVSYLTTLPTTTRKTSSGPLAITLLLPCQRSH